MTSPTNDHANDRSTSPSGQLARTLRVRKISLIVIATSLVLACGLWGLWPLGPVEVDPPEFAAISAAATTQLVRPSFDLAAFNAPLWVAPAPPPKKVAEAPPPPPPPPPPPLRWQLLAIIREDGTYRALLYDPDADKLFTLTEGEQSGSRRIVRITPTSVDIRDEVGTRTLPLGDSPPPPATGAGPRAIPGAIPGAGGGRP
jgi:hypothetical protein